MSTASRNTDVPAGEDLSERFAQALHTALWSLSAVPGMVGAGGVHQHTTDPVEYAAQREFLRSCLRYVENTTGLVPAPAGTPPVSGLDRAAVEAHAELMAPWLLQPSETAHRIGAYVEAGTPCTFCGGSYWRCTNIVFRPRHDPEHGDGCCDQCLDSSGHSTRILGQIEGLIAETTVRTTASA